LEGEEGGCGGWSGIGVTIECHQVFG
jgi:hypothetical protein